MFPNGRCPFVNVPLNRGDGIERGGISIHARFECILHKIQLTEKQSTGNAFNCLQKTMKKQRYVNFFPVCSYYQSLDVPVRARIRVLQRQDDNVANVQNVSIFTVKILFPFRELFLSQCCIFHFSFINKMTQYISSDINE